MAKKIQVFNRHCPFSSVSQFKLRPTWFNRENCHNNLLKTINRDLCDLNIFFDGQNLPEDHFTYKNWKKGKYSHIVHWTSGSEAASFSNLLEWIVKGVHEGWNDQTIIYIVEDDYLHAPNWSEVLLDGFETLGHTPSYFTLYDHNDKYTFPQYKELSPKIIPGQLAHWRTTPSTTNTYAGKLFQFKEDYELQRKYSEGVSITRDHDKFLALGEVGRTLYSCIPGYSTHCEPAFLSPVVDWAKISSKY